MIEATRSNADKTEWTANYKFRKGQYNEYMSGDRLYTRIVTDRKVGDGRGEVVIIDERTKEVTIVKKNIPAFNETTYQAIATNLVFIEAADREPNLVDFDLSADFTETLSLPVIGSLTMITQAAGINFGVVNDGDRIRLMVGKPIDVGGTFKANGKVDKEKYDQITQGSIKEQFSQYKDAMHKTVEENGENKTKKQKLVLSSLTFSLLAGVSFEFQIYHEYSSQKGGKTSFEFTGASGYFGIMIDFKFTTYIWVVCVPMYFGVAADLEVVIELGVSVDEGKHIPFTMDYNQSFFDDLINNSHFDFIVRAVLNINCFVGVGICGVIGARGGISLQCKFIAAPLVAQRYSNVRPLGFSFTGCIKVWLDVVLFSIPIPVYQWLDEPFTLGYFEDIKAVFPHDNTKSNNSSAVKENSDNLYGAKNTQLKPKPRFSSNTKFVANDNKIEDGLLGGTYEEDGLLGGTYESDEIITLLENVYDISEPHIVDIDITNHNKALLLYLDDDANRGDLDRTTLKYMIYDKTNTANPWSEPRIIQDDLTADFSPNICEGNLEYIITWASRPDPVDESTNKADLLRKMEIYTARFNVNPFDSAGIGFRDDDGDGNIDIERLTKDNSYDYSPNAVYYEELDGHDYVCVYYLKKDDVVDIDETDDVNDGEELLDQAQTEVNNSQLMYMIYGNPDGDTSAADYDDGKRWLRDYCFDYELVSSTMTPDQMRDFILNTWQGQRIKNLSIADVGGINPNNLNNPRISDYKVTNAKIANTDEYVDELEELQNQLDALPEDDVIQRTALFIAFIGNHPGILPVYNTVVYNVDADGDPNTIDDTEMYVKIASGSDVKTIRLTNNQVSDTMPKILYVNNNQQYLFWIQNESMIKMLSLNSLIEKARAVNHFNNDLPSPNINIMTTDKVLLGDKISNIYPFVDRNNNVYVAYQQNSDSNATTDETVTSGEINVRQDLYVAGLIRTELDATETDRSEAYSWSNPVRFTDNSKFNDLPTAVDIDGELLLVNNQYNFRTEGEDYIIENSNLVAMTFKPKSSIEALNVDVAFDSENADGSKKYKVSINIQNTGLSAANGYDYNGTISYDNQNLVNINGTSDETLIPGNSSVIGGKSSGASTISGTKYTTPDIYITLSKEQQRHIDKVKLNLNIKEHGIVDQGINYEGDVFNVKEKYRFDTFNIYTDSSEVYGQKLRVEKVGDDFVLRGHLENVGNIDSKGDAKIYIYDQKDWDNPIAVSDYIDLQMSKQMKIDVPISDSVVKDLNRGIKDYLVYVKNDAGDTLSNWELATLNIREPYKFKVNDSSDTIKLKVGETLKLNTTFEPADKYTGATILYSVEDADIARSGDNTLYGVAVGETTLHLTTKEYGGKHQLNVIVEEQNNGGGRSYSGGGSSGGGGGAGPALPYDASINTMTTNAVKANSLTIDARVNNVHWIYDPISNRFRLNVDVNGAVAPMTNGFITITDVKEQDVQGVKQQVATVDTYFFDVNGNMITGWLKTADNKWYFFENQKTINEGKMVYGWRKVGNNWYYFLDDGSMLVNAMTPDGEYVGADGAWIAPVVYATQQ